MKRERNGAGGRRGNWHLIELLFWSWWKPKIIRRSPHKFINNFICSFQFDFVQTGGYECVPVACCWFCYFSKKKWLSLFYCVPHKIGIKNIFLKHSFCNSAAPNPFNQQTLAQLDRLNCYSLTHRTRSAICTWLSGEQERFMSLANCLWLCATAQTLQHRLHFCSRFHLGKCLFLYFNDSGVHVARILSKRWARKGRTAIAGRVRVGKVLQQCLWTHQEPRRDLPGTKHIETDCKCLWAFSSSCKSSVNRELTWKEHINCHMKELLLPSIFYPQPCLPVLSEVSERIWDVHKGLGNRTEKLRSAHAFLK